MSRRTHTSPPGGRRSRRGGGVVAWLFLMPAAVFYTAFVLLPFITAIRYSLYEWNGISAATPVGLANYVEVITDPKLMGSILHSFVLMIFFTVIPTALGLIISVLIVDIRVWGLATAARTVLFLPQIIPGAAAAIAWVWMFSSRGAFNQILEFVGLGRYARAWLGDFTTALPAVGIIGFWLNLGFCTVLLLSGIGKIDAALYEAARLDGAGFWGTFRAVTLPGLKQEIGVCMTMTMIAALASFDVVYMSTQGGPGDATMVPGVMIYQLAFTESRVGLASALAVVLTVLIMAVILPLQRAFREG